jgi:hypothetical protein
MVVIIFATSSEQPGIEQDAPVMKVTRNPNLLRIHPEIVNGQMKYAPK